MPPLYAARLTANATSWWRPIRNSHSSEAPETYRGEFGFGHEDWLFRDEWIIDGWRYGFVQGVNKSRKRLRERNEPFDLLLFEIAGPKQRRFVSRLHNVECLSEDLAQAAVAAYRERGWLAIMEKEVLDVGGDPVGLANGKYAEYVLNIRFRLEDVDRSIQGRPIEERDPLYKINRYSLCSTDRAQKEQRGWFGRSAATGPMSIAEYQRTVRASSRLVTPEHARLQAALADHLQATRADCKVLCEQDFIDVQVISTDRTELYEIKSDLDPLSVVRQAIGQLVEYAFHPRRSFDKPLHLFIVGRRALAAADQEYFEELKRRVRVPLDYLHFEI